MNMATKTMRDWALESLPAGVVDSIRNTDQIAPEVRLSGPKCNHLLAGGIVVVDVVVMEMMAGLRSQAGRGKECRVEN